MTLLSISSLWVSGIIAVVVTPLGFVARRWFIMFCRKVAQIPVQTQNVAPDTQRKMIDSQILDVKFAVDFNRIVNAITIFVFVVGCFLLFGWPKYYGGLITPAIACAVFLRYFYSPVKNFHRECKYVREIEKARDEGNETKVAEILDNRSATLRREAADLVSTWVEAIAAIKGLSGHDGGEPSGSRPEPKTEQRHQPSESGHLPHS